MGDPAGIGPDCTLFAWSARNKANLPPFALIGDPAVFSARSEALGLNVPVVEIDKPEDAVEAFAQALPVFSLRLPHAITAGVPDETSAAVIIEAIKVGFEWTRDRRTVALVTNPINKKLLMEAGFSHPGHTEFLAQLCSQGEHVPRPVMLLTSGNLRAVPVTVHIPHKDVSAALSEQLIVETVEIVARAFPDLFDIASPRIGVTGLNPHAGEDGTLGREELDVIIPAIGTLQDRNIAVTGPLSADAAFQERVRRQFDVIVAMYHDQALIPVKTLAFDRTVNTTLGLPIVRTSPDHGTAYELAGTGDAHPGSLIEALRLAQSMANRQLETT
ncbi:MAG: 4-hydroxythreonine-4-phosphate dehydrogenase PdxA [Hyphomicrobiaceae bacterium]|nr:4-hydroxythreonine-4-phosphate dehydrogenase PdxA [Hyphomicrobiaceae bacterium]